MSEPDPFDLFWQWATKPVDSYLMIDAEIHHVVMALPEEERRDREVVNAAVRKCWDSLALAATRNRDAAS